MWSITLQYIASKNLVQIGPDLGEYFMKNHQK